MSVTAPLRGAAETVPIENEISERVVRVMVFGVPPAALVVAGWLAWGGTLHWQDLLVLAITYTLTGLGVTVGYHRLFTHRSVKTTRALRALLAVLGSMAVQGPLLEWVATHRKHHRFSDQPGDPHSPHLDHAPGWRGALRGLGHAHVGWMFRGKDMANPNRYAKDLLADPRPALDQPHLPALGSGRTGAPLRPRRRPDRLDRRRAHGTAMGRSGTHLPAASRDLQHQLAVPLLRPATVRYRRSVAQPRLARTDRPRRSLAQQPPRLPNLSPPWPGPPAARPKRLAHQRSGALPPRLGRRPNQPRTPANQTSTRGDVTQAACTIEGVRLSV
jgi:hypothetical protein